MADLSPMRSFNTVYETDLFFRKNVVIKSEVFVCQ